MKLNKLKFQSNYKVKQLLNNKIIGPTGIDNETALQCMQICITRSFNDQPYLIIGYMHNIYATYTS